jgi:hypothetical protein
MILFAGFGQRSSGFAGCAHIERGGRKKYHGFMAVNFQDAKIISIVQIHI